jgi:hypothetical protein
MTDRDREVEIEGERGLGAARGRHGRRGGLNREEAGREIGKREGLRARLVSVGWRLCIVDIGRQAKAAQDSGDVEPAGAQQIEGGV